MKLSPVAPVHWWRQVSLWAMNLPPGRFAALMASGTTAAMAIGQWLGGTDHSLAEWFLQIGTHWLVIFLLGRLIAPVGLIQFRGHIPKGGYDVHDGSYRQAAPSAATIHG